jgi:hypothetical protein
MDEVARVDKANSIWDDVDIDGGKKYGYQLLAYAEDNLSNPREVYLTAESTSSNTITDYDGNVYNTVRIG